MAELAEERERTFNYLESSFTQFRKGVRCKELTSEGDGWEAFRRDMAILSFFERFFDDPLRGGVARIMYDAYVILMNQRCQGEGGARRENTDEPTRQNTDESTQENTDESTQENTDEPTRQNTDESTQENTDEPTRQNTDESTQENTDEPTRQNTDESTQENTDEPTRQNTRRAYPGEHRRAYPTEHRRAYTAEHRRV
ncbi:hypothetical protein Bbelb_334240 [Branchiostoma belcheri]|nr:hypothetical protein Bbelb_334240 [Branchiostoma belcheri]